MHNALFSLGAFLLCLPLLIETLELRKWSFPIPSLDQCWKQSCGAAHVTPAGQKRQVEKSFG
jgi:hypothetical protein